MGIRIEIERLVLVKVSKAEKCRYASFVSYEPSHTEALAYVDAIRSDDCATVPFKEARLYDDDTFRAWVRTGGPFPVPYHVVHA